MHTPGLQRLASQRIAQPASTTPTELLSRFGAIQGQDYNGAKWSLGLRLRACDDTAVEQALNSHAIIRTWLMRGTLHMAAAADLAWMLPLFAERIIAANARRYRELELDTATLVRSSDLIAKATENGARPSRKELYTMLEQAGIATTGQRGIYMLQRASYEGLVCQAESVRSVPTFVNIAHALPPSAHRPREEALAELARRYFTSHGPATVKDFAWWLGLPLGQARSGLAAVEHELTQQEIDGATYWGPQPQRAAEHETAFLLPGFDEFLLGYTDRSAIVSKEGFALVVPGNNGMFMSFMVLGGRIIGLWKRVIGKRDVRIELQPFEPISAERRQAFAAPAAQYGAFLGLPALLVGE